MLQAMTLKYNNAMVITAHPSLAGMSSGTGTSGFSARRKKKTTRSIMMPANLKS